MASLSHSSSRARATVGLALQTGSSQELTLVAGWLHRPLTTGHALACEAGLTFIIARSQRSRLPCGVGLSCTGSVGENRACP